MDDKLKETFKRKRKAVYIRFNEEEYKEIEEICLARKQKMQHFIKSLIFKGYQKRPLMDYESAQAAMGELKKIGNNFNQIAKHLNSGLRRDWSDSFERMNGELSRAMQVMAKNVAP